MSVLSEGARDTTVEALARQLNTDATHLAKLAQDVSDKPTVMAIVDALDCAALVAATADALRQLAGVTA